MKMVTKIAVALLAIVLSTKLDAQQSMVVINLTGQTAYLLENGRVAFVSPIGLLNRLLFPDI